MSVGQRTQDACYATVRIMRGFSTLLFLCVGSNPSALTSTSTSLVLGPILAPACQGIFRRAVSSTGRCIGPGGSQAPLPARLVTLALVTNLAVVCHANTASIMTDTEHSLPSVIVSCPATLAQGRPEGRVMMKLGVA